MAPLSYVLCALIATVSATDFYITSPYSVTNWKAGTDAKITWDIIAGGPKVTAINVDLMDGDDNNARVLMPVVSGLAPDARQYQWKVPADFPESTTLFVRVSGTGGESVVQRYSHRFAVKPSGATTPQEPARQETPQAQNQPQNPPVQKQSQPMEPPKVQPLQPSAAAASDSGKPSAATASEESAVTSKSEVEARSVTEKKLDAPMTSDKVLRKQVKNAASSKVEFGGLVKGIAVALLALALW